MTKEDFRIAEKRTYEFLNKINLKDLIKECKTIDELQFKLSVKYNHTKKLPVELQGFLFNAVTTHEFAMYCKDKYKLNIHEDGDECYVIDGFKESVVGI